MVERVKVEKISGESMSFQCMSNGTEFVNVAIDLDRRCQSI